jgi:tetraacyldisaccharide 4'-kinase
MYAYFTFLQNYLFEKKFFKASEFDIPIINVGNLAVGGSGKSPMIEYLITLLSPHYQIATLSRGYGRTTKGFREVLANSTTNEAGDEPVQFKTKFPFLKVFVGEDRVESVTQLLFEYPSIELILLDDAFQHRAIKAGLNILLTDYSKIFTRDLSMPLGRLREFPAASQRAQMVVVTKCPANISEQEQAILRQELSLHTEAPIMFSYLVYDNLKYLSSDISVPEFGNILTVTGLANPKPMIDYLQSHYNPSRMEHLSYPDHHRFNSTDLRTIKDKFDKFATQNKVLVVSEKDGVRLKTLNHTNSLLDLPIVVLPIRIAFIEPQGHLFNQIIENYVQQNTNDN